MKIILKNFSVVGNKFIFIKFKYFGKAKKYTYLEIFNIILRVF